MSLPELAKPNQMGMVLENFYGLDIRRVGGYGDPSYMLAGEWFGRIYVDYVSHEGA